MKASNSVIKTYKAGVNALHQLEGVVLLEGERDLEMHGLKVDVIKRDIEADPATGKPRWDMNIIIYVLPGSTPCQDKIQAALKKVFGTPRDISLIFQDQHAIRKAIGVPLQDFNNFFVGVGWPRSSVYKASDLKAHFIQTLAAQF